MARIWLALALGALTAAAGAQPARSAYRCLEGVDDAGIGDLIREVGIPHSEQLTVGQLARRCLAACDEDATCSAAWAVSGARGLAPMCRLLQYKPRMLGRQLGLTPRDGGTAATLGWLCFKHAADFASWGAAVFDDVMQGSVAQRGWCARSTDVAGTNLLLYTNITSSRECAPLCAHTPGCSVFLYEEAMETADGGGQAKHNCFLKQLPGVGENGWTAAAPHDGIFKPNTSVACFLQQQDWDELGLQLNPFVQTVEQGGVFFTLFPERVPQSTAAKMCTQLDGGRLAVLPSRALVNMVGERLLRTVPLKHSLQAAWTAVAGINAMGLHAQMHDGGLHHDNASTCFKPTAKGVLMLQLLTERSLHWYNSSHASLDESSAATGNQPVDGGLLAHLQQLKLRWTVHDLLAQQLAVPMTAEQVCGQLVMQLSDEIGPRTDATPGIWWFDCERAAPFICESRHMPDEPMQGRFNTLAGGIAEAPATAGGTWRLALAVLLPVAAIAFIAAAAVVYSRNSLDRLADLLSLQRKRARGCPSHGPVTILVTDIEDSMASMASAPREMAQALLLHNALMRKTAYAFAGHIIEQEGDSFTLAFASAVDGVGFALAVQQAMVAVPDLTTKARACSMQSSTGPAADLAVLIDYSNNSSSSSSSKVATCSSNSSNSKGPWWRKLLQSSSLKASEQLSRGGLRVRIGIASGCVARGEALKSTSTYSRSRVISEAANGGQVLCDASTFQAISSQLHRLGAVTADGVDHNRLGQAHNGVLCSRKRALLQPIHCSDAVVLDMGLWRTGPLTDDMTGATDSGNGAANASARELASRAHASEGGHASELRLYQVLSPPLIGRAAVWGDHLGMSKQSWHCVDQPFFAAPGLTWPSSGLPVPSTDQQHHQQQQDGCSSSSSRQASLLRAASLGQALYMPGRPSPAAGYPPVTAVFVAVEGSEQLLRLKHQQPAIRQLHHQLKRLMLDALQLVAGGYFVRAQDGELRYFLSFATPTAAVEWCLIIQEAALVLPYPDVLLAGDKLPMQHDAAGRLVFRGPRLRMGVCQGVPEAIIPDSRGRADVHGPAVNLAARFCDAAHGGQVVTETALAQRVLQQWASGGGARRAPPGWAAVSVEASHLGLWLFKGSPSLTAMASLAAQCHAGRTYPADAPTGKGVRVSVQRGQLGSKVAVMLPTRVGGFDVFPCA